jgi:phosphoenolpyruvate-protein kinase (PTS system EI component)
MKLLARVVRACNEHGKPVTLCGEMAGWPRCFLPLFGMGLRRLSMSPAFVPTLKEVARHTTRRIAEAVTRRVLTLTTAGAVRGYLTRKVREVWPNVSLIDTRR